MLLDFGESWVELHDGDRDAFRIFRRHYSFRHYADGRRDDKSNRARFLFCGPGEKMVLLTPAADALFVWRKFIDDSGQRGVNCAVFRNEGPARASDLILQAEALARKRWPGQRFYTFVNASKLTRRNERHRKARRPGHCFRCAGWVECGVTKSGLLILEKKPFI